ncbi:hypothetical protein ACIQ7Q_26415 [Streptomyces sp. NPDC096176]|uniref:hypothetical protein n=1 Tax=Streptomyces sp. NPDC096176 TaxID=3366079 RepID=UPI0037FD413C
MPAIGAGLRRPVGAPTMGAGVRNGRRHGHVLVEGRHVPLHDEPEQAVRTDAATPMAGTGMTALSLVNAWWLHAPVFAWCGLGLGLGWTFSSVATQQVVAPARAGEASGVLLTFLVTLGAIALAAAAATITAMAPERPPEAAYDVILRVGGAVILAASVVVIPVRQWLVAHDKPAASA